MHVRLSLAAAALAAALTSCGSVTPATLEFVEFIPAEPRIGEVVTLRFKATDYRGEPLAGANVDFRFLSPKPGVSMTPKSATTLKGSGYAETQLVATSRVTAVIVVARAGDREVSTPPLSFAGSIPNGRQFTFQCGSLGGAVEGGIHAISTYDETRHLIAGVNLKCYAHTGDRNGDGVPGALVSFMTEAGTIGPTDTTVADVVGNAEITFKTSYPLPKDVDPVTWNWTVPPGAQSIGDTVAPVWMQPFLWTSRPIVSYGQTPNLQEPRRRDPVRKTPTGGNIMMNVRDNLVAMIAVTSGEEGFTDTNNNGKYDPGEPFDLNTDDLTEPFVDSNDNSTYDLDEKYIDTDGNGAWDGKNGIHDDSTLLWRQEKLLWTGIPHALDTTDTADPVFRLVSPDPTMGPPLIRRFGGIPVALAVCDPWLNSMAQNGGGDGCESDEGTDTPLVRMTPKVANGGIPFTYPACTTLSFYLIDARDPNQDPPVPIRNPPALFSVPICCTSTAAPEDAHKVKICVSTITGFVE